MKKLILLTSIAIAVLCCVIVTLYKIDTRTTSINTVSETNTPTTINAIITNVEEIGSWDNKRVEPMSDAQLLSVLSSMYARHEFDERSRWYYALTNLQRELYTNIVYVIASNAQIKLHLTNIDEQLSASLLISNASGETISVYLPRVTIDTNLYIKHK